MRNDGRRRERGEGRTVNRGEWRRSVAKMLHNTCRNDLLPAGGRKRRKETHRRHVPERPLTPSNI